MPRESEPFQPSALAAALKEAVIAAAVAFGLFGLMVGIKTDQGPTSALVFTTRFDIVGILVAIAFVGRFIFALLHGRARAPFGGVVSRHLGTAAARSAPYAAAAFLIFALIVPIVFYSNRYWLDLAILIVTYAMLGFGLNIVVGLAGLLDLGYVAFYAVGAYTYGLLSTHFGFGFWESLPIAGGLAAAFGMLLGYPTLRLRGDYLAIVTLGFGEIIRLLLVNWGDLTGGPNGISSIPKPTFFGLPMQATSDGPTFATVFGLDYSPGQRVVFLYYLILVLALLTNLLVSRLKRLPVGRAWEAVREDEIACKAMGINVTNVKLSAFATGAMLAGFDGVFFAARQGFISPESFTFSESATILAIVVLGGMGSQLGVVLAAALLVILPELGRDFTEYRMLLFGIAMVFIMIVRPGGLISHRRATVSAPGVEANR